MKIAILSLVLHTNYGGILQSYALQTVLERMGHQVEVLSRHEKVKYPPFYKYPLCIAKRIVKRLVKGDKTPIFLERYKEKNMPVIRQHTNAFIDKYNHVRYIDSFSEIKESDYDAFVVGSDQVWRPKYFEPQWNASIDNAFLSFTKGWNVKRIAYAPSFGVDSWEYTDEETLNCAELLKDFDVVTVREDSGVNLIKKHFGVEAQHVLDPTMLLSKEDYEKLFVDEPQSKGNLLVYMLDDSTDKQKLVTKIAKEKGLTPFSVIAKPLAVQTKVETWLKGFADAKLVVTDSFHACVFSIIFGKPFVVVGNEGRGQTRIQSLFTLFGIRESHDNKEKLSQQKTLESFKYFSLNYLSF